MAGPDASSLSDFVIPILLESSEGFKPMIAKRKFDQAACLLAKQAYWLCWFEWLAKMEGKVESLRFATKGRSWRDDCQEPRWAAGHAPTKRELSGFQQARKRAISKLHAKLAPDEGDLLAQTFGVSRGAVDDAVSLADKDRVIGAVLGPQLAALRMSKAERGALEELLWEPAPAPSKAPAGSGRPRI